METPTAPANWMLVNRSEMCADDTYDLDVQVTEGDLVLDGEGALLLDDLVDTVVGV